MNRGYTPDQLVEVVALPPHLAEHPWLGEYYGTVKHSVRQIYVGYLGWFQADPWELDPMPYMERAKRYVKLMGGYQFLPVHEVNGEHLFLSPDEDPLHHGGTAGSTVPGTAPPRNGDSDRSPRGSSPPHRSGCTKRCRWCDRRGRTSS